MIAKEPNSDIDSIARLLAGLPAQHKNGLICSGRFHLNRLGLRDVSARNLVALVLDRISEGREHDIGADSPTPADFENATAFKFYLKAALRSAIECLAKVQQENDGSSSPLLHTQCERGLNLDINTKPVIPDRTISRQTKFDAVES